MRQEKPTEFDQVYSPDYEAAQDFIKEHPDVPHAILHNVEYLAGFHARLGPRDFKLVRGLAHPRHPLEAHFIDIWSGVIGAEELTARGDAHNRSPVTLGLLAGFQEDLSEANVHYDQMLLRIRKEGSRDEVDPPDERSIQTISYYARELTRRYSVTKYHLYAIHTLAEECRAEAGRPLPTHGQLSASSAAQLARHCHDLAADNWFRMLRLENSRHLVPHLYDSALHHFKKDILPHLPDATWLQTIASEEFALVRLFLRKHGPYPVDESVAFYGIPDAKVADMESQVPVEAVGAIRKPSLANWGFGYDGIGKWYLFHKNDGRWEKPGKVEFPGGLPSELMELFAENGGALNWESTAAWRKQKTPRIEIEQSRHSLIPIISRMRKYIKTAIASAGRFDVFAIDDPLPLMDGSWIAAVQIGFAVQNDAENLVFKRKEDM